ncbi:hypothetical protein [Paenibacillus sp. FSL R5-0486]|uniref:hypothetical protein n=1 Tax=Paenibacillus sp. FSL R5-0486 TaxID=2921645 RepID=UPI0030D7A072
MTADQYTFYGFWISSLGTLAGIFGLIFTWYVSSSVRKIRKELINDHIHKKFISSKPIIIRDLISISEGMIEDNTFNKHELRRILVKISMFKGILSKEAKEANGKLINLLKSTNKDYNAELSPFKDIIYELILLTELLDFESDEREKEIRRITK